MFKQNDKLIELLKIDNDSQMSKKEYEEMIKLLDSTRERIVRLNEDVRE